MKNNLDYPKKIIDLKVKMNVSQEKLADILGVSFQSLNRCNNSKSILTKLAWVKLTRLLTEYETIWRMKRGKFNEKL